MRRIIAAGLAGLGVLGAIGILIVGTMMAGEAHDRGASRGSLKVATNSSWLP